MNGFTMEQVEALLKPIKPSRVMHANGQSHVPAFDVAAHLTRIFGYGGWDTENCEYRLAFEDSEWRKKDTREYQVWTVGYTASITLIIKDRDGNVVARYSNGAGGDAVNQPSRGDAHHLAMTTAISTALKRCAAFGLGDQFGLSLYNKGMTNALVKTTLVMPDGAVVRVDVEEGLEKPESLGNDEKQIGDDGGETPPAKPVTPPPAETRPELTEGQKAVREHPRFKMMDSGVKGAFLSDKAGHPVHTIRDLDDDDCEAVLAALRSLDAGEGRP